MNVSRTLYWISRFLPHSAFFLLSFILLTRVSAQDTIHSRIGTITIDRQEIFDTLNHEENNFIGSLANSLHWLTKEHIIRGELLLQEGSLLDPELLRETERNLRALGFIGNVSTTVHHVNDSTVNLTVHTRDKWTLGVSPSYQQGGGTETFGFLLKDDNFLGNAQTVSVNYKYRSDMANPHGVESYISDRRLFGTRWGTTVRYKNSEQLRITSIMFDHPYFSDEATWAASAYTDYGDTRRSFYENDRIISENIVGQHSQSAYYSRSFGGKLKLRPSLAFMRVHSNGGLLHTGDNLDLLSVSLNVMQRTYYERVFLDNHGRIEDVPLGFTAHLLAGKNLYQTSGQGPSYYLQADWQHSLAGGNDYYFGYSIGVRSFAGGNAHSEGDLNWSFLQYYKLRYNQIIVGRVEGIHGFDWPDDRQLYLGTSTGLRGYENYDLTGTRRLLYNIEYRYFSPAQIWIFRPGAAVFWDGGTVWQDNETIHGRFHNSIGCGLRIENTKQQGAGTIRVDLAFNLDTRRFSHIIISSSVLLSAFQDLNFISPLGWGEK